ncbi:WD40 repeat-like protein [Coprinopsis marcescibilis]|uniref:WD40 repeat-like protein n=1 Tax=Coprinopsis marcescibilis TaxID=230819 RepID=A0A5C3L171_COPMA|nr:WD40 repeat-like protein [Coprinopsis marcescibilis]
MSGMKNSPFGKRLRASHVEEDDGSPKKNRKRANPTFGVGPADPSSSTPSLDSRVATGSDSTFGSSHTPRRQDYGDRFVPSRDAGDMRTSYHLLEEGGPSTPSKTRIIPTESDALKEQANTMFTSILQTEVTPPSPRRQMSPIRSALPPSTPTRRRLFTYSTAGSNPATPSRRMDDPVDEAYAMSPVRAESRRLLESPRRQLRSVCKTPYRVLDAPELADDFYLNLVDWSSTNVLGVGLGSCVYLWQAQNANVNKLCDLSDQHDSISSLSWVQKGSTLAVGTLSGQLKIYDANTLTVTRTYQQAHTQRIGALAWNSHILSSGSRDRTVHHRDVREPGERPFKRCTGHRQEVCGLKWSGDGSASSANLASGGNDNKVCIWDLRGSKRAPRPGASSSAGLAVGEEPGDTPVWKFHEHTAAVKALAWDPHVTGVLATGGGTQDKHIRFWNVINGTMTSQLDTGSQVCNLVWSTTSHELVSTHGFSSTTAQNQICIWKYPALSMVASLTGHTNRVLYLAMSPDGETIVTGAGDETLRFWNAFPKRERHPRERESKLDYAHQIR